MAADAVVASRLASLPRTNGSYNRCASDAPPFDEKPQYLICDHDKKYGQVFERMAKTSGVEVIRLPNAAPRANAIGKRFVGSLRRECLDYMLAIGGLQLIRILSGRL